MPLKTMNLQELSKMLPLLPLIGLSWCLSLLCAFIFNGLMIARAGLLCVGVDIPWKELPGRIGRKWWILFRCELLAWGLYLISMLPLGLTGFLLYRAAISLQWGAVLGWVFGCLLALSPGLILYVWFWFRHCHVLLEENGARAALQRSVGFGRHSGRNFWEWSGTRISVVLLVLMGLGMVLGTAAQIPMIWKLIQTAIHTTDPQEFARASREPSSLSLILTCLANALILPLLPIARVVLFYDLKVRREHFDLELLSRPPVSR
jgi:hypothetical protein